MSTETSPSAKHRVVDEDSTEPAADDQLIEDAQVAGDAYRSVLGRVTRGHERARALRDQARTAVRRLESGLEEARALEARLVRLEQRRKAAAKVTPAPPSGGGGAAVNGSGTACILERPYSFIGSGWSGSGARTRHRQRHRRNRRRRGVPAASPASWRAPTRTWTAGARPARAVAATRAPT